MTNKMLTKMLDDAAGDDGVPAGGSRWARGGDARKNDDGRARSRTSRLPWHRVVPRRTAVLSPLAPRDPR